MGESLETIFDTGVQVQSSLSGDVAPGLNWQVSEETKKALEDIRASMRAAEQMSGHRVAR